MSLSGDNRFSAKLIARHAKTPARVMRVTTPHGVFTTPAFMPVGTRAGVNNMTVEELLTSGSQIILGGNTYHMLCAPGMAVIEQAGGMHPFMAWQGPMLTDSGGFQVFSLPHCNIDEQGAHFKREDGQGLMHMTPQLSLETQKIIGADIIMAFDQCTPDQVSHALAAAIMQRTHRWLLESIAYHQQYPNSRYGAQQALFGIIQGGAYPDLREQSAEFVASQPVAGIAIGGETVGFDMPATVRLIQWVRPFLPEAKLRYTMGVGMFPQDLLDVVAEGIDMFDCVAPTRNARHGSLYCGEIVADGDWLRFASEHERGRIQIKKACYATDPRPIMLSCACPTCRHYSRSDLHHLFKKKYTMFSALASMHNIHVLQDVCDRMRRLIQEESL